jgi:hypothetical protein
LLRASNQNVEGLSRGFDLLFLVTGVSLALSLVFLARMEEKPLRET